MHVAIAQMQGPFGPPHGPTHVNRRHAIAPNECKGHPESGDTTTIVRGGPRDRRRRSRIAFDNAQKLRRRWDTVAGRSQDLVA